MRIVDKNPPPALKPGEIYVLLKPCEIAAFEGKAAQQGLILDHLVELGLSSKWDVLPSFHPRFGILTHGEGPVVEGVCRGLSNKQIGKEMGISEQTVKNRLGEIFEKYGVTRRTELMLAAWASSLPQRESAAVIAK